MAGEAKAHHRLLAFARKAEEEGYPQIAKLLRAVSAAEGVHADNHLRLLGEAVVRDTQANLSFSFETEKTVNTAEARADLCKVSRPRCLMERYRL